LGVCSLVLSFLLLHIPRVRSQRSGCRDEVVVGADDDPLRIKTETGERGWVPAWFIGKISSGSASAGTDSNPSTATGPKSADTALGSGTGGTGGAGAGGTSGEEEVDTSFESAGSKEDGDGRREGVKGYL
jgi:hypothetical protein